MVICKFYQAGNCRFGDTCRNEHPKNNSQGPFGNQNRFGALQGNSGFGNRQSPQPSSDWSINVLDVRNDLTDGKGRPKWILSAYGPGKGAPDSVLQKYEYSPEEVRARFYDLSNQGKQDQADQESMSIWNEADQAMRKEESEAGTIQNRMQQASQKHPNREDVCKFDGTKAINEFLQQFDSSSSSGFGSSNPFSQPNNTPFGQSSSSGPAFGQGMFSKPSFGQSAFSEQQQSTSAFGQTSSAPTFGQGMFSKPAAQSSPFGQPSFGQTGFGQEKKNPFAPAAASGGFGAGSSAFGQSAQPAFGRLSQSGSAFGQTTQQSAFGQPSQPTSAFGQATQPPSAFGQPSQPTSAFGQPSQSTTAFGQPASTPSGFGQPPQPSAFNNPFAKPAQSTFGQPTQPDSVFGQPAHQSSAFGQTSQPPSGFGQAGFGNTKAPGSSTPPFGSGMFGNGNNPFGVGNTPKTPKDSNMDAAPSPGQRDQAYQNPFVRSEDASKGFGTAQIGTNTAPPRQPAAQVPNSIAQTPPSMARAPSAAPITALKHGAAHPLTGKPSVALTYTETLPDVPNQKNRDGILTQYRGRRVVHEHWREDSDGNRVRVSDYQAYERPDRKGLEKVWYPDGAHDPVVTLLIAPSHRKDLEAMDDAYTEEVKEQYRHVYETGKFTAGKIPLVPPMRDWICYDF